MRLSEVLSGTGIELSGANASVDITGITQDSRPVK